jgi:hypothetical protein
MKIDVFVFELSCRNQDQNNQFLKESSNRYLAHDSISVGAQNFAPRSYRPKPSPGTMHVITLWLASEAYTRGQCATARRSTQRQSISSVARSARREAAASVRGCLSLERARAASYGGRRTGRLSLHRLTATPAGRTSPSPRLLRSSP